MASKPETKKVNPIVELEREQAALLLKIDEMRSRISSLQTEISMLLAAQRSSLKHRLPLEQALQQALATQADAQSALQRHLGSPNEDTFADRLVDATEETKKAQQSLHAFDRQYDSREKVTELRADIQRSQEELHTQERRQTTLTHELDQAIADATNTALVRVLNAFGDLYNVLAVDGPVLARTRISDPLLYRALMSELPIDQDALFALIQSDWTDDGSDDRPVLRERMQIIRDHLARLK